jgi:preprotein translocase subunit YajC
LQAPVLQQFAQLNALSNLSAGSAHAASHTPALAAFNLGQYGTLPFLVLMFVAMYFLLVMPNQRKQKQWQAMLAQIKAGDRVTTNAGIRGTVVAVKDDVLVIKTQPDGVKLEFVKSAIAAVTTDDAAGAKTVDSKQ